MSEGVWKSCWVLGRFFLIWSWGYGDAFIFGIRHKGLNGNVNMAWIGNEVNLYTAHYNFNSFVMNIFLVFYSKERSNGKDCLRSAIPIERGNCVSAYLREGLKLKATSIHSEVTIGSPSNHVSVKVINLNAVTAVSSRYKHASNHVSTANTNSVCIMSRQLYSAQIAAFAGSAGLVCGMLYGTQVTVCPYPQLALGAHVQFMQAGLIGLAAGAILGNTSLCQLNEKSMFLSCVDWAHYLLLAPSLAEAYSAFQGKGMPLVRRPSLAYMSFHL